MKKIITILSILAFIASCKPTTDKKAQLDNLIKERDKLNEQIATLEQEIIKEGGKNNKIIQVGVEELKTSTFRHYIEVQGKVDGDENIAVTPRSPGVVTSIAVTEGQKVSKGQVLAILDSQVLHATLTDMENQLVFVSDIYNRQKNLWEQNIGSEVQYLTAKNNKESLENKIKTLKDQISMTRITSPIDGTIEEIPIKVGQMATPGVPAFRVVNFSKVKVVADVAEVYSPKVKNNDSVLIFFPDLKEEIKSRLNFTSKFINPVNRSFVIESRINSTKFEMRANMIAVIKINDYKAENVISIPANLVQKSMNEQYVFVAVVEKDKKIARKKIVKTGISYNGMIEITEGLTAGDNIITTGYLDLNENDEINY
jgi:RND family efflux transporter MFP subunit